MSRTVRDAKLESRTARAKLAPRGKPYFRAIDPELHLGYRKGAAGGRWVARWYIGDRKYETVTLDGITDDNEDPDGARVLSFGQAQATARTLARKTSAPAGPLTVKDACLAYIEYLRAEKKTGDESAQRLKKHVYPDAPPKGGLVLDGKIIANPTPAEIDRWKSNLLGGRIIAELVQADVDSWKRGMVRRDAADDEVERKSKDSANRLLTMVKAALNRVFNDDANKITSDVAWRRVKPFPDVGRAREAHLDQPQCAELIKVTSGGFRNLVIAALLTGARPPHELAGCKVRDFHATSGTLSVDGKTGHRDIVLTAEAVKFFKGLVTGRDPSALLLPKDDGTAWGKNHHQRLMADAVTDAKLPADTGIYTLRHTHASQSILAGMNLKLLAENMGTSILMLEKHYGKFIAASRRKLVEESSFKIGLISAEEQPNGSGPR
jgi:integrase